MDLNCYIFNYTKPTYIAFPSHLIQMPSKWFQINKSMLWLVSTLHKLTNHTWFITFLNYISAPIILYTLVPLIGIILPLIRLQIKLLKDSTQRVCWAWKFHQLSNHMTFIFFWIILVPQNNVLLQCINRKQKTKKRKGLE